MKVLCDVCGKEGASVFCCADEAALCDACDRRVHRANKLVGKHRRFSLSAPSAQSHPACDICQVCFRFKGAILIAFSGRCVEKDYIFMEGILISLVFGLAGEAGVLVLPRGPGDSLQGLRRVRSQRQSSHHEAQ